MPDDSGKTNLRVVVFLDVVLFVSNRLFYYIVFYKQTR